MAIRLTGLGGFDSSGVIDQLVEIAREPLRAIDTKVRNLDSAKATMTTFSSKLAALKTAALALSTPTGFSSMTATSSEGAVVPTVSGTAVAGTYSIEVGQLARVQKSRTALNASSTTALGQTGDITFTIGGASKTVSIVASDTLSTIASKIAGSGARVTASVLSTGSGYQLVVQGLDTGAANGFTVTENGTALGLTQYEDARDAQLTIDGQAISRPTNQIADAIPGITFAVTKKTAAGTPATLAVNGDPAALKSKVDAFVTAYNDVVNTGHNATGWGAATKATNALLAGDSSIRRALDRVASLVTGGVPGASTNMRSLISVGLSVAKDGRMTLDASKLDAALKADPQGVQRLFVVDASLGMTGVMKTIGDAIESLVTSTGGAVKSRIESLGAQSKRLTDSRASKEKRVEQYETQLRKQYAELDVVMSRYTSMATAISGIGSE